VSRLRIAVLTGGGDAPGLNAVIRAVVKSAVNRGWEVSGIRDGFEGFFSRSGFMPLAADDVRGILQTGGTILGTSNRGDPFAFPKDGDHAGEVQRVDRSAEVLAKIDTLSLDALVVIGGDGSLGIAQRLGKLGVPVVGIPKTIDNDVSGTDVTFGFNTACQTAMEAIDRLHTTAASHQRVMVIEVMGRDAGWIALKAGASGGGDVILIPEIPYDLAAIRRQLARREARGARFSLVVVSEGAREHGGRKITQVAASASRTGFERLGGVGHVLSQEIERQHGIECRVTVLGHVQRGGTPTTRDRMLGTRFGVGAVDLVEAGKFQTMVALRGERITDVPLDEVVGKAKLVDPEGQEVRALESVGVSFGRPES
jgi:ATP-dependent phosphofructokinase / diphosphate-dependent phosphofructokinase